MLPQAELSDVRGAAGRAAGFKTTPASDSHGELRSNRSGDSDELLCVCFWLAGFQQSD